MESKKPNTTIEEVKRICVNTNVHVIKKTNDDEAICVSGTVFEPELRHLLNHVEKRGDSIYLSDKWQGLIIYHPIQE